MSRSRLVVAITIMGAALFAFLHFLYSCEVGLMLYRSAGGIRRAGTWTEFGGAPFAWAIPLELPGTLLLHMGIEPIGALLVLSSSAVAGYALTALLVDRVVQHRWVFGRWCWRAAVLVLGFELGSCSGELCLGLLPHSPVLTP